MKEFFILAVLVFFATSAQAKTLTATEFVERCEPGESRDSIAFCLGFATGVVQTLRNLDNTCDKGMEPLGVIVLMKMVLEDNPNAGDIPADRAALGVAKGHMGCDD